MEKNLQNLDLTLVKIKLMDTEEGQGWTKEQCEIAELEYKRFLNLIYVFKNAVPTKAIDIFWHQHILDTRAYAEDSIRLFGEFLHHFPYFGMFGEEDNQNLIDSFEQTKHRYKELYGEELDRANGFSADYNKCHTCHNQCSHCNHPLSSNQFLN